jgi:hypothetical protein
MSIISEWIGLQAERKLQEVAIAICEGLTPAHMETMAKKDLTLAQLLRQTGHTIPKVSVLARPGVDHLARMSDEEILKVLEEVVPDNVMVLRRHPNFCRGVIRDLKTFATG